MDNNDLKVINNINNSDKKSNMGYIKSPMNYTGGKYKLLPQILPLMSSNINKFVDLFTGGANVIANVEAKQRVANDFEKEVIEIYDYIQSHNIEDILNYIHKQIDLYELSMTNEEGYKSFRKKYNSEKGRSGTSPIDLFILICYSFNHQIRFNSKGEYNMPFGRNRSRYNGNIEKNLISFKESINDVEFISGDFGELDIDKLEVGDYVYCDPPYLITCASYNEQDGWNIDCENRLLKLLDELDNRGIHFGLSNVLSNKGKTNEILNKWLNKNPQYKVHHLNYTYSNCNYHAKDKESSTDEVFITNYQDNQIKNELNPIFNIK